MLESMWMEWGFVSATWDGETLATYINGELVSSQVFGDGATPLASGCTGESTLGYIKVPDEAGAPTYHGA